MMGFWLVVGCWGEDFCGLCVFVCEGESSGGWFLFLRIVGLCVRSLLRWVCGGRIWVIQAVFVCWRWVGGQWFFVICRMKHVIVN